MKARVNVPLTPEYKRVSKRIMAEIEEKVQRDQSRAIARSVKIACLILNTEFGFGLKRLVKFLDQMESRSKEVLETPEQWHYIDEYLEKLGVCFEREDIDEREEHSRDMYHADGRKYREYGGEK